jgi:NYN domain
VDRCALFVDAGYVLADGAMAVHGTRHRDSVSWDYAGLVKLLSGVSRDRTGLPILRCYWYEATVEGRRNAEHNALADLPGVKLRMGRMRPGRREGVEAEMHRDLTTLARNHAVSDAVIVSAEEDLAEVVVEVQDFGLRVVIVHIAADGNWTVSRPLREECDDIVEITAAHLRPFVDLIPGAEPADQDDQYRNGGYQRGSISNGHGPALGAMTHQGLPAAALPAPPAIYTGPVVEEYHRTAQPAGQGPLALSALAAAAAVGPPPSAHHAPAPPAPAQQAERDRGPAAVQSADQPVAPNSAAPESRTGPQPQAALPARVAQVQAGSADQNGASAMAGQPLAAPTLPPGYGAGPGDHVPAHGGYAFMPSEEAGGGRNAAGAARESALGRSDVAPGVPAQPAQLQDALGQGPAPQAPVQQPAVQQAPVHQASGQREPMPQNSMPQNPVGHNGLPQNAAQQNGLQQGPVPESTVPQNHLQDLGHVGHNPVQASPAQPYPQPPPPQGPDEARFAPGQGDYRAPDLPAPRGGNQARDALGTAPGPQAQRPAAPPAQYAENGSPGRFAENGTPGRFAENGNPGRFAENGSGGRFAENGNSGRFAENGSPGRFAENGDPGRFADNPLPGRFADGPAPSRFADGPAQARFAEGPGQSRFADGAAPARFGEGPGPGPSRFAESQGQPPYPPAQQPPGQQPPAQHPSAPPGAFGPGSAAQVQYPQFNAAPPGQHAAHAARPTEPAPGYPAPPRDQGPYSGPQPAAHAALPQPVAQPMAISLADAVQAAHAEGFGFGDAVARDAPALWLEAVLARKPRMPSDLEARLLQGSALPIDSLLHDEVRHSLRRGFWDALERSRR